MSLIRRRQGNVEARFGGIDAAIVEEIMQDAQYDQKIVDEVIIPYARNKPTEDISRLSGRSTRRILDIVGRAELYVIQAYLAREESVPQSDREVDRIANMQLGGGEHAILDKT